MSPSPTVRNIASEKCCRPTIDRLLYLPRENLPEKLRLTYKASFVVDGHLSRSNQRCRSVPRRLLTISAGQIISLDPNNPSMSVWTSIKAISRTARASSIHFYGADSGSNKRAHDLSHALPFLNNVHKFYARAGDVVTVATNAPAPVNIMAEALATQSLICLSTSPSRENGGIIVVLSNTKP